MAKAANHVGQGAPAFGRSGVAAQPVDQSVQGFQRTELDGQLAHVFHAAIAL